MADASRFAFLPEDLEGFDLSLMLCNKCTLGCNVIRIVPCNGEKLVLCGKRPDTQEMLNAQRERLGIAAPGQVS
ncbi:MAG: hypothetical protein IKF56_00260 [Eggerthellaceae bacterium]|jgi:hypothetical protein|nr:hypothetical protein [Eggerthellaceae bacterium]